MAHQKEQWRKIPKAPLYDASSDGRIMSVRHKHIIIPKEKDDGLYIDLMVKGEFMEFYVPDLVLSAFSPTYLFGDIISFRDGNKYKATRRNMSFSVAKNRKLSDMDEIEVKEWKCEIKSQSANQRIKNKGIIDKYDVYNSLLRTDKSCFYCNSLLDKTTWELDHFSPLSNGGENTIYNIVPSCNKCNRLKGSMHYHQMISHIHKILKVHVNLNFSTQKNIEMNSVDKIKEFIISEEVAISDNENYRI